MAKQNKSIIPGLLTILLLVAVFTGLAFAILPQMALFGEEKLRPLGRPGVMPNEEWECHWLKAAPKTGDEFNTIRPCSDIYHLDSDDNFVYGGSLTPDQPNPQNNIVATQLISKLDIAGSIRMITRVDGQTGNRGLLSIITTKGTATNIKTQTSRVIYSATSPPADCNNFGACIFKPYTTVVEIVAQNELDLKNLTIVENKRAVKNFRLADDEELHLSFNSNTIFSRPGLEIPFACTKAPEDQGAIAEFAGPRDIDIYSFRYPRVKFCLDVGVDRFSDTGYDEIASPLVQLNKGEIVSIPAGETWVFKYTFDNSPDENGVRPVTTACSLKQLWSLNNETCVESGVVTFAQGSAIINVEEQTIFISSEPICDDQRANLVITESVNGQCSDNGILFNNSCYKCPLIAPQDQYCEELTLDAETASCKPFSQTTCDPGWIEVGKDPLKCEREPSGACALFGGDWTGNDCIFASTGVELSEACSLFGGTWNGNDCIFATAKIDSSEACKLFDGTWTNNNCIFKTTTAQTSEACSLFKGTWTNNNCIFAAAEINTTEACKLFEGTWTNDDCIFKTTEIKTTEVISNTVEIKSGSEPTKAQQQIIKTAISEEPAKKSMLTTIFIILSFIILIIIIIAIVYKLNK